MPASYKGGETASAAHAHMHGVSQLVLQQGLLRLTPQIPDWHSGGCAAAAAAYKYVARAPYMKTAGVAANVAVLAMPLERVRVTLPPSSMAPRNWGRARGSREGWASRE